MSVSTGGVPVWRASSKRFCPRTIHIYKATRNISTWHNDDAGGLGVSVVPCPGSGTARKKIGLAFTRRARTRPETLSAQVGLTQAYHCMWPCRRCCQVGLACSAVGASARDMVPLGMIAEKAGCKGGRESPNRSARRFASRQDATMPVYRMYASDRCDIRST
jgi:hypothetical protein